MSKTRQKASLPTDYIYIRKWGKFMLSYNYYIEEQVRIAHEDNAPENAIFKDSEGIWHIFDDIASEATKSAVEAIDPHGPPHM